MEKRVGLMFRWPGCKGFLSVVWLCGWVGQRKGMNEGGEKQESRRLVGNVAWWDASRIHRGEERRKRRKGGKEKRRKKEEECRSWLCSNSKEHSRRTLSPLFLLSFLRLFVFLSFSILRNGGSAARRKIQQATGSRVMGMKNAFSSSFLLLSSTVSSPFWFLFSSTSLRVFFSPPSPPSCRLDADGITAKMIPRDFEAPLFDELLMPVLCTVERRTYLCYRKKNFMEVKSRAFDSQLLYQWKSFPSGLQHTILGSYLPIEILNRFSDRAPDI